ncbi:MAG: hypothetical protein ACRDYY_08065 [Acidimicrobiales bacterium]
MTDNSAALRAVRRRDALAKRQRAAQAIQTMIETGIPSRSPPSRTGPCFAIAQARDRQYQAGAQRAWRLPARSLVTEQSLRADLALLTLVFYGLRDGEIRCLADAG